MPLARRSFFTVLGGLASSTLASASPAEKKTRKVFREVFELKVQFHTPITPELEMTARFTLQQPFAEQVNSPDGHLHTIGGMLLPREGKKYPLVLTLLDHASPASSTLLTTLLHLVVDEPYRWGTIGGGVSSYTVILKKATDAKG